MPVRTETISFRREMSTENLGSQPAVRVLRSTAEVEEIRWLWQRWQWHPNSDIDHYLNVLQSGIGIRPHVMVVYRGPSPEALLVGRLEERRVELKVGHLNVRSPRVRSLTFIYGGLLGNLSPEGADSVAREILDSLRCNEAPIAYFNCLPADTPLYRSIAGIRSILSRDHFPKRQSHRAMAVPGSVDDFYGSLSPKVRKNQRWQSKKLLQDCPNEVRVDYLFEASDLDRMFVDVEAVAKKTYQRGLRVGFVDSAEMRGRLRLQAEKGWLRAYVLYIKSRPAAFWMGTLYKRTFHSDRMGYDPHYARYSPGMFLIMKVIEGFCGGEGPERTSVIDFDLGDAQYKQVLGDRTWDDASIYLFGATLHGAGLNLMRTPIVLLDSVANRFMKRTAVLRNIKRAWRNVLRERRNSLSPEERETTNIHGGRAR